MVDYIVQDHFVPFEGGSSSCHWPGLSGPGQIILAQTWDSHITPMVSKVKELGGSPVPTH